MDSSAEGQHTGRTLLRFVRLFVFELPLFMFTFQLVVEDTCDYYDEARASRLRYPRRMAQVSHPDKPSCCSLLATVAARTLAPA